MILANHFIATTKNVISYDNVYSYSNHGLDYTKIEMYLNSFNNCYKVYLDAYNDEFIQYLIIKMDL